MPEQVNPLVGKTDNRKAGCGKSASPVWREGKPICLVFPTLSTPQRKWLHPDHSKSEVALVKFRKLGIFAAFMSCPIALLREVKMSRSYWVASIVLLSLIPPITAEEKLVTKTYSVADLVIPLNSSHCQSTGEPLSLPVPMVPKKPSSGGTCEEELIRSIKQIVAHKSWTGSGGRGTIEYYPIGMSLVVEQTAAIHDELGRYLKALSKEMDHQVAMEFRLVTIPTNLWESWLRDRTAADQGKWYWHKRLVLDDRAVTMLMQTVQTSPSAHVLQAPKVTAFDGQHCCIEMGEKFRLCMHPRLGEDRKSIGVSYHLKSPGGLSEGLVVSASGQTTLIAGWCSDAEAVQLLAPELKKSPWLNLIPKNTPKVCVLLVTPRVISPSVGTNAQHPVVEKTLALIASGINGIAKVPFGSMAMQPPTMKVTLKVGIGSKEPAESGVIQVGGVIVGAEVKPISELKKDKEKKQPMKKEETAPGGKESMNRNIPQEEKTFMQKVEQFVRDNPPPLCIFNKYDTDPEARMRQMLKESEDLRAAQEKKHPFWMNQQPSALSYDRLTGAIVGPDGDVQKSKVGAQIGTRVSEFFEGLINGIGAISQEWICRFMAIPLEG